MQIPLVPRESFIYEFKLFFSLILPVVPLYLNAFFPSETKYIYFFIEGLGKY